LSGQKTIFESTDDTLFHLAHHRIDPPQIEQDRSERGRPHQRCTACPRVRTEHHRLSRCLVLLLSEYAQEPIGGHNTEVRDSLIAYERPSEDSFE
jgi:hypothetical protein